ncbi:transcription-repair coupling factor [Acidiphilium sp. CAG:727]|nr:transcription-repair coupling factor [Acidiphilium sp. CAG:727]
MLKDYLTPENLGGELAEIGQNIRGGIPSAVFGVNFAEKCLIASSVGLPVLYIVKDGLYGVKIAEELTALSGERTVYLPAKDDVLLYKSAFDRTSLFARLNALYEIKNGARFVVTTFQSLLQLFPRDIPTIKIRKNEVYDIGGIVNKLVKFGYRREEFADDRATFALRGDILEINPVNGEYSYRVDFFGDEVESVFRFYGEDRENKTAVTEFEIIAATDVIVGDDEVEDVKQTLRQSLSKFGTLSVRDDARKIVNDLEEKLDGGVPCGELQFVMPILKSVTDDFTTYMPTDTLVVYDESKMLVDGITATLKDHSERLLTLGRAGKIFDFSARQLSDCRKLIKRLNSFREVAFQNITTTINFFNPLKTYSLRCSPVARYTADFEAIYDDVKNWKFGGYKVIICCGNDKRADSLSDELYARGCMCVRGDNAEARNGVAVVTSYFLPSGLIYHSAKLVLIGTGDLYIATKENKRIKRKRGDLFQAPEVGDYAVHEVHGIGYVKGVKRITTQEGSKDYVAVEYLGGDTLYVGVDQMDKLTKYMGGGEKPRLNRIGGKEFERIKERVKASISEMTIDLKKLYKARKEKKGFAFSADDAFSEEFDEAFEFEPTEDQIQSVAEIKADMESEKVMDRLLCGDVGFGKTEVAFRAAFKAIADGKQVALVCPTTILCEQHYRAAKKRFENFGVRIESLNRFKTSAQQKKIITDLADGLISFVIGTHRLFGSDVKFHDLGLLVLDEEQRFGVEHKEKLKLLKENVDTLTMTATPIPRTLHMSLAGIRDISVINTPPNIRIPVQTYVVEESDALFKDAITRELAREGQVLVMHNRVETIYKLADKLKTIVPEAKIIVAHGQMDAKTLEDSVMKFYDGDYNVLVATTIIENGIDLPRANTIIVTDSDKLGLSTLYQLKGRVGRSNVMAHAYFTFDRDKVMSEAAYKRLSALTEFTEMGSGYKIAMRDLEIRGAGNVMGKEQHGHMDKVGYELYNKLLTESLGETKKESDVELDVNMDAYIPEDYISTSSSRMDCYKQIAEITADEDDERVTRSLEEYYGKIPREVRNLILIAKLKAAAKKRGAVKVAVGSKKSYVELADISCLQNAGLMDELLRRKDKISFEFSATPVIDFSKSGSSAEDTAKYMLETLK